MLNINPNINIFDKSFNLKNTIKYVLSIQLRLNGFSFSILNSESNNFIALKSVNYNNPLKFNSHEYFNKLNDSFSENEILNKSFKRINIIIRNYKSTLIPFPLFEVYDKNNYAFFNNDIQEDDLVVYDKLTNLEAYNVYTIPVGLKSKLIELFPESRVRHFSTPLIEGLLIKYKNQNINKAFLNVEKDHFDLVIFNNYKLIFFNSFEYKTDKDFIYFLLFTFEQLKINPENFDLVLLGNILKGSKEYNIILKYVRNVSFIKRNDYYKYSYLFEPLPQHFFYNLLNSDLCE
ncbi:MAG: DUF3822 family protein [Bacteroidales bacterium]|nr:DUF3822 family protein [Bacteroidales bacterium]